MSSVTRGTCLLVCLSALLVFNVPGIDSMGVNGGMGCAACTIVVSLTQQLASVNNVSVVDYVSHNLCLMFQGQYSLLCGFLVTIWGQAVVEKLVRNESPDVVCYSLGICHVDPGHHYCHLFPEPQGGLDNAVRTSRSTSRTMPAFPWIVENVTSVDVDLNAWKEAIGTGPGFPSLVEDGIAVHAQVYWFIHNNNDYLVCILQFITERFPDICHLPGMIQVCDELVGNLQSHLPSVDVDRDKYSVVESLRGSLWRGKDCNDIDSLVYPGRKPLIGDSMLDSNCNGIMGINTTSGLALEEELCTGDERGLLYIGDSIGARFHIPENWMIADKINTNTFGNISVVLSNQFDWPQLGFSTGFRDLDWSTLSANVDSIYSRLRARNRCNHRDYQNISFNGAESNTMIPFLRSISRDKQRDKPVTAFYALMGNDVCKRNMVSPGDNKSPEAYRSYVMESLNILNQTLPDNSHVILIGLVNGSFIYETMHDKTHPIGHLNNDVTYADVYDWWNCMEIGPCFGWMNSDLAYRNATSELATQFTLVLQDIASTEKFASFKLHFLENPLPEVMTRWQQDGKNLYSMLEPVDSLHPVQDAQPYITEYIWSNLESRWPETLGRVNPNNQRIAELFGEQGGH